MSAYKFAAYRFYSGGGLFAGEYTTHYGGIRTGAFAEFMQTGKETCGQAAAAFFLNAVGVEAKEKSLVEQTGKTGMVSLADLERLFIDKGFNTQTLKVEPGYFQQRPVSALLHFKAEHFVVFINAEKNRPMIFDPAYGQVYVDWDKLSGLFSGYMLYVYQN